MVLYNFLVIGNTMNMYNVFDEFRLEYIDPRAELVTCFLSRGPYNHYINGIFECDDDILVVKFPLRHYNLLACIAKKDQINIDRVMNCGYMLNNITKTNKIYISGFEGISNKGDWFIKLCSNFREFINQQGIPVCRDGFLALSNLTGIKLRFDLTNH